MACVCHMRGSSMPCLSSCDMCTQVLPRHHHANLPISLSLCRSLSFSLSLSLSLSICGRCRHTKEAERGARHAATLARHAATLARHAATLARQPEESGRVTFGENTET